MPASKPPLENARASFDSRAWREAFDAFARAESDGPLERDDLEKLVWSAALRGQDEAFLGALERLFKACVEANEPRRAARAAFWLGYIVSALGSTSAAGWLARAERLIAAEEEPGAERGYLLLPSVYQHLAAAEDAQAGSLAGEAASIGERYADQDLIALARNLEGRALIRQGRVAHGLALLDEVMIATTAGDLSPLVTGIVYCNVIVCCQQIYALDRAREWTAALERWCADQPQLVTFTGHCLVHRVEIMQLAGAWEEATEEVRPICEGHGSADPDALGDAHYQQAELLRLRGQLDEAEEGYRLANENGRDPQPGLALLRLTQGRTDAAASTIRRALSTTTVTWQRVRLLPAFIEIMLAAGSLDEARSATRELSDLARAFGTEILGAVSAHARGAVAVAKGDHLAAVEPLRHAFAVWNRVGAPYIAARVRVLLGRAYLGLDDAESAHLERAAARKVFESLGARPDLDALPTEQLDGKGDATAPAPRTHGLSTREVEVLRLLASGMTNKDLARELGLSERTVHRHVSNIFAKIGVSSRAAATAFAYENELA